jgi:hypothetical protein
MRPQLVQDLNRSDVPSAGLALKPAFDRMLTRMKAAHETHLGYPYNLSFDPGVPSELGPYATWQPSPKTSAFASEADIHARSNHARLSAHAANRSRLPDLVHQLILANIPKLDRNVVHLTALIMFKAGLDFDRNPLALLPARNTFERVLRVIVVQLRKSQRREKAAR